MRQQYKNNEFEKWCANRASVGGVLASVGDVAGGVVC